MFWRHRKVLRDRAAGMVFDWRRGHGSAQRLVIATVVSATFWGVLLAYVQIREPESLAPSDEQINLTIVDLDANQNRWLAELIDRETLFHQRWDVSDSSGVHEAIEGALARNPARTYTPTLRQINLPDSPPRLRNLPGYEVGVLPRPDSVESVVFASPPVNWWIEVKAIDGPEGLKPFAFRWEDAEMPMSEGEMWTILMGVDRMGRVSLLEVASKTDDPRTEAILGKCRALEFPSVGESKDLRWWKLEAIVVNRPISE